MSTQQPSPEAEALAAALEPASAAETKPVSTEEQGAAEASARAGTKYHPSQVPYLNDAYTYQDRLDELDELRRLTLFRLRTIESELAAVRDICQTRTYPNIAFREQ